MALTTAQQVRLKIADAPLLADATYHGDGTADSFVLPHSNITSATAYVPLGATAWTATGCTFNASGAVAFSGVISANSAYRVTYTHSTFSDEEIGNFLTAGGASVNGAALEACEALMFDATKRSRWMAPDGSQFDDTKAQDHLRGMWSALRQGAADEAIAGGSIASYSLTQGDY